MNPSQLVYKELTMTQDKVKNLESELAALRAENKVLNDLLAERDRLLKLFDCPSHGQCVPFAIDEVNRNRAENERLRTALEEIGEKADQSFRKLRRAYELATTIDEMWVLSRTALNPEGK